MQQIGKIFFKDNGCILVKIGKLHFLADTQLCTVEQWTK